MAAFSIGAIVAALAAFLAGFLRFKPKVATDDSPIIVKGGSLSIALHDDIDPQNIASEPDGKTITITDKSFRHERWYVGVAQLEGGFPTGTNSVYGDVASVALQVVNHNGRERDVVKITHNPRSRYLRLTASQDNSFGQFTTQTRRKSKKHRVRVFYEKIRGQKDFDIGEIVITPKVGIPTTLPAEPEYALSFWFEP